MTDHKIRWFVYETPGGDLIPHAASHRGSWPGFEAKCSCGWESHTGGATRTYIKSAIADHKLDAALSAAPTGTENPMRVTICGPNLNDQSKGQFHIHAADCADLKKHAQREPEYRNGWTIEASSRDEVGDSIYEDHIEEGSMDPGEGTSDCHFFPCTAGLK